MLWIIVEDTKSGKRIYELMVKAYKYSNVKVVGVNGNSQIYPTLKNYLESGKISSSDKVLIACDNIMTTNQTIMGRFTTMLQNCKMLLNEYNIKFEVTDYVSIEEALLSFGYLLDFCGSRNTTDKQRLRFVSLYNALYKDGFDSPDYSVANNYLTDKITIEKFFSMLLSNVSYNGAFNYFRIVDKHLFPCWEYSCKQQAYKIMSGKDAEKYCSSHSIPDSNLISVSDEKALLSFALHRDLSKCGYSQDMASSNKVIVPFCRLPHLCEKCKAVTFGDNFDKSLVRFDFMVRNSRLKEVKKLIESLLKTN